MWFELLNEMTFNWYISAVYLIRYASNDVAVKLVALGKYRAENTETVSNE